MRIGDRGYFGRRNGEKTFGEVVKVNRKTVKVRQLVARGTRRNYDVGTVWTVAKTLWTPEVEVDAAHRPAVAEATFRGVEPRRRPEAEILAEIRAVEVDLSPENLSRDGELSPWMTEHRGRALRGYRAKLVRELGREPTFAELRGC